MSLDPSPQSQPANVEAEVIRRYGEGARRPEPALCCPTDYESEYLELIPAEIRDKDYGCGNPSKWVRAGERVLDLGSGGGKICYILAQKVGPEGSVIGADFNDEMLALARRYQGEMARRLGFENVRFIKARIQDLALDLERVEGWLRERPVDDVATLMELEARCDAARREAPAIPDGSIDVVVSNCVLNLVKHEDKDQLFREIHRVLRRGGRAVISDIVADEPPTEAMRRDPDLWSGCISGAFLEEEFLERFERAGFHGVEILERSDAPWQVVEGIEFRSLTVRAYKGKAGPCLERNQAVIYKGPWRTVTDDDGHTLARGRRMAVCDKTFHIYTDPDGPYAGQVVPVPPREEVPLDAAPPFDCAGDRARDPRETKGAAYGETSEASGSCCGPEGC